MSRHPGSPVIGIDYTPAYEQGAGIGRYVRELVAALARLDEATVYRLFIAGAQPDMLPPLPGRNFTWRSTRLSPRWMARIWQRLRIPLPVEFWLGRPALFHATDFVLPPTLPATRTLLTVHDLSFVHVPETTDPRLRHYLDVVVPRSVRRADHVLADSQATRNDLIALYDTPADKITVLLSGVSPQFGPVSDPGQQARVRGRYGLGAWPFLFTVGTIQPRKNYVRLCQALTALPPAYADLHLVIAGGKGWLDDPIFRTITALGLEERVHLIGYAAEADLPVLYSMAAAVPFLSLYEGFGLPVLEAMACGTPVVTSTVSSMPEVAGDAALLVDPYDVDAIAHALERVLSSSELRRELIERGLARAAQFTWDRAARQLLSIYHGILAP